MLLEVLEALALMLTGDVTVAPLVGEDTLTDTDPNAADTVRSTNAKTVSFNSCLQNSDVFGEVVEAVCAANVGSAIRHVP